jgi:protoporphyrinogen/coproporphyrinogen III oxidase
MALGVDRPAVVIGGGITGLVCTWRLRRLGVEALCLESSNRAGGALSSQRTDGFVLEAGAHTVRENASLGDLIREVGLGGQMLRAPRNLTRFVYRFGSLHPLPTGILSGLGSRLISTRAKMRLLGELAVKRRASTGDESVEAFVRRRFGVELVDALVAPFVSGTFAGDPSVLSARALVPSLVAMEERYGSALRGMLASAISGPRRRAHGSRALISFRDGLETLPARLAARLGEAIQVETKVLSITHDASGGRFDVEIRGRAGQRSLTSRTVIAACSAWDAASLLDGPTRGASRALSEIPAASLATVSLSWPREDVSHPLNGVGFLVAAGERLRTLGCLWNSSIFPGRAPADQASFTAFLGGVRDPQAATLPDDDLVTLVGHELAETLGTRGRPRALAIARHRSALPQYGLGHRDRVTRIRGAVAAVPGLFLAGNYLDGVSVGECARQGERAAADVHGFLSETVDFSNRSM